MREREVTRLSMSWGPGERRGYKGSGEAGEGGHNAIHHQPVRKGARRRADGGGEGRVRVREEGEVAAALSVEAATPRNV